MHVAFYWNLNEPLKILS